LGQRRSGWERQRVCNRSIDAGDTARPRTGRRYPIMRCIGAAALVVGVTLALATGAPARSSHKPVKCKAGYVRRSVRVAERRHGQIVRRHSRVVYKRVWRCVRPAKRKPSPPAKPKPKPNPSPPASPPGSSSTTPAPPVGPVVPSPTAPVNTTPPTIGGTATAGNTLIASTGSWTNSPTSFGYHWQRCDSSGGSCSATPVISSTYALTSGDVGSTIRVSVAASNGSGSTSATSAATGPVASATSPGDPVVVAAGDIARPPGCSPCEQSATATLAQTFSPTSVFLLGDNQYNNGSLAEYTGSYALTWGRDFDSIVHPIPGNHEYGTAGAAGYLGYFGQAVANPDNTPNDYYSFNLGTWHIDALNSDCKDSGSSSSCSDPLPGTTTTAQNTWLQTDLAHDTSACTLAMWHHPLFSSGWTLGSPGVAPLWNELYQAHADIVLGGHDHLYERYAQQDPSGTATTNGIREFVVGTGGESLNGLSAHPTTLQASDARDYGVLVLTLHASSYSWKFVNTGGATVDSGTTACHGPGAAPLGVVAIHRTSSAHAARLDGPALSFDARPIRASLKSVIRTGLAVAIHASRGVDVVVTASLRRGRRLQRIASFYETESQIPKPYSQILVRPPARSLQGMNAVRLVLRFAAVDSAEHRRTVTRTVSLR
jgi:hypothetical protein